MNSVVTLTRYKLKRSCMLTNGCEKALRIGWTLEVHYLPISKDRDGQVDM